MRMGPYHATYPKPEMMGGLDTQPTNQQMRMAFLDDSLSNDTQRDAPPNPEANQNVSSLTAGLKMAGARECPESQEPAPLLSDTAQPPLLSVPRKIVWGMLYDCEDLMLELKLNEVGHLVDHFVLVEGAFSLQNTPRAQCFPELAGSNPSVAAWLHKITYVYDTAPIQGFQYWEAEVYYRDLIGLKGVQPLLGALSETDWVLVSDVDELVTANFLHLLKWQAALPANLIEVRLLWTYYSFLWVNPQPKVVRLATTVAELRDRAQFRTNAVRFDLMGAMHQPDAVWRPHGLVGWHCSWCLRTEQFVHKMQHFAHSELNTAAFMNLTFLTEMRSQGLWFPDRAPNGCIQRNGPTLPDYVKQNMGRYALLLS